MSITLNAAWLSSWSPSLKGAGAWLKVLNPWGFESYAASTSVLLSDHVVVGHVLSADAHPQADRLRVCQVDVGQAQPLQIVCGCSTVRAGLKVAVACVGASLPGGIVIQDAQLRGVMSQGMLCSAQELGLCASSSGIVHLPSNEQVGVPIQALLDPPDQLLNIDITPDRGDCMSVMGLARESSTTPHELTMPVSLADVTEWGSSPQMPVGVMDTSVCRAARWLDCEVDVQAPTPLWMLQRLAQAGLTTKHLVVDVLQYVMLEMGQPMHAYDRSQLAQGTMSVRRAQSGEALELLQGDCLQAQPQRHLWVCRDDQPVALAGVMGGQASAVTLSTTSVRLEALALMPACVALSHRSLGGVTEAGMRFERGVDAKLGELAMRRALWLLQQYGQARVLAYGAWRDDQLEQTSIEVSRAAFERTLGCAVKAADVEQALKSVGCELTPHAHEGWLVHPPSWRFDLMIAADLVEEYARKKGYDVLPSQLPVIKPERFHDGGFQRARMWRQQVAGLGFTECYHYSFHSASDPAHAMLGMQDELRLRNPLSESHAVMRRSLWPGLLQAASFNVKRQQASLRLFEVGRVYSQSSDKQLGDLVSERLVVAGLCLGHVAPEQWGVSQRPVDFYDVKGCVEALLSPYLDMAQCDQLPGASPLLHPGQSLRVQQAGQLVAELGMLHPRLVKACGLPVSTGLFSLNVMMLAPLEGSQALELGEQPSIRRDLSLTVPRAIEYQQIRREVRERGGDYLQEMLVFDHYKHSHPAGDSVRLGIGLVFRNPTRTLRDDEVDSCCARILDGLKERLGITMRGEHEK